MQIRPATSSDLPFIPEIDGTIESLDYLHLDRTGEGLSAGWRLEIRKLGEKLIESNRLPEINAFTLRQIATGIEEGIALVCEIDDAPAALLIARLDHETHTIRLLDLRVDYDRRRQGIGLAMAYHLIMQAQQGDWRALAAETRTNNLPANRFLEKLGFTLAGVDTMRHSNHDLVKETATLLWYLPIDKS